MNLSPVGAILYDLLSNTQFIGENISMPTWIIMPNHFHAIVIINNPRDEERCKRNDAILPKFIGRIKSAVSREIHKIDPIFGWQRSFHDRMIRTIDERNAIVDYITSNVERWGTDKYFCKHTW